MLLEELNRLGAVRRFRDKHHVGLVVDERRYSFTQQGMIVDAEHSYLIAHFLPFELLPSRLVTPRLNLLNQPFAGGETKAMSPGIDNSTSVPARARLQTRNRAPILSARSRIPAKPQCPSRPESSTF